MQLHDAPWYHTGARFAGWKRGGVEAWLFFVVLLAVCTQHTLARKEDKSIADSDRQGVANTVILEHSFSQQQLMMQQVMMPARFRSHARPLTRRLRLLPLPVVHNHHAEHQE